MLRPEVCNFKPPDSSFTTSITPDEKKSLNIIENFKYNHLVSVIIPDTHNIADEIKDSLSVDCDYYKINNFNLKELIDKNFITNFINSGKLYGLSVNARIDCDNCVAITPEGKIILNIDKSTYHSLGLDGKVSHFTPKSKDRFIVVINLKLDCFKPNKPNYKRVSNSLERLSTFDIIIFWEPPNDRICPSSIAKYFYDLNYQVKLCTPKFTMNTCKNLLVPTKFEQDNAFHFTEWLGMVTVGGTFTTDDYLSSFEIPEPNVSVNEVQLLQWQGFFTTNQITKLYNKLRYFQIHLNNQWIAIYVQGFSDSPVAWGMEEHHYYTNGDNGYLLVFKNNEHLICNQKCTKKRYRKHSK